MKITKIIIINNKNWKILNNNSKKVVNFINNTIKVKNLQAPIKWRMKFNKL